MIYYVAHWDKILLQSRGPIVKYLATSKINAICPIEHKNQLNSFYNHSINWEIDKTKILDFKGIFNLASIIKNNGEQNIYHIFTLKSGILFMISKFITKNKSKNILSVTGLGYLFSKNLKAKILRVLIKPIFIFLINKTFHTIIFQNKSDLRIFSEFTNFKNESLLIESSGIETNEYIQKKTFNSELKVLMSSRLLIDKGIRDFVDIANKNENKKLKFFLSGEIDYGNPKSINHHELQNIINNSSVEYLGYIDLRKELHNYDIIISLSDYEGFSRVLLEAAWVGLFCISTLNPGTEFISYFENSKIIDNKDNNQILLYLNNLLNSNLQISNKNKKIISKNYTSSIIANQFSKLYYLDK